MDQTRQTVFHHVQGPLSSGGARQVNSSPLPQSMTGAEVIEPSDFAVATVPSAPGSADKNKPVVVRASPQAQDQVWTGGSTSDLDDVDRFVVETTAQAMVANTPGAASQTAQLFEACEGALLRSCQALSDCVQKSPGRCADAGRSGCDSFASCCERAFGTCKDLLCCSEIRCPTECDWNCKCDCCDNTACRGILEVCGAILGACGAIFQDCD